MVLIEGGNGQGKSNLLEALYLLAIAKSTRATTERELVRRQAPPADPLGQVVAEVRRERVSTRVQVDFRTAPGAGDTEAPVLKQVRVNGLPRRASDLVGEVNAVMFSAQDLDLVLGPPSERRRYLDILISQLDRQYLRTMQRYQRVVSQRNHLLRAVKEGRSRYAELEFWNDELAALGGHIMHRRRESIATLSLRAGPVHLRLSGNGEGLELAYRPNVAAAQGWAEEDCARSLAAAFEAVQQREVAQGFTVVGPHRDDLQMLLDGMDVGVYASRGQCRTVALAMRLAEASYLKEHRGHEPVLLLDDVLSELDPVRRLQVLEHAGQYQQCFITTADVATIDRSHISGMSRFLVRAGMVEAGGVTGQAGPQ